MNINVVDVRILQLLTDMGVLDYTSKQVKIERCIYSVKWALEHDPGDIAKLYNDWKIMGYNNRSVCKSGLKRYFDEAWYLGKHNVIERIYGYSIRTIDDSNPPELHEVLRYIANYIKRLKDETA